MDDETILLQASDMIRQQQKVAAEESSTSREPTAVRSIMERLNFEPVSPEVLAERERVEAERKAQQRVVEIANRQASLAIRVGKRYANASLDDFETPHDAQLDVLGDVRDYSNRVEERIASGSGLFLIGPPGTGKDHLIAAVLFDAVRKGIDVAWTDGMQLFAAARDNIDANRTEAAWLSAYTKPTLLAISDPVPPLGSVKEGFQLATLFSIIDRRYRDMKPTLMTLNVNDRDEAEKRMAPNIVDRLAHGALVLRCDWPSYRRN
jgi:DNA replication protein DnaC